MEETKKNLAERMIKSSSIYAFSGLLRNLVGFVMLPIYTRYLSPADYGIVALMIFVISLIEITLGARMGHAPQKFYYEQDAEAERKKVISTALLITAFFSLIVTILAISQSEAISHFLYGSSALGSVVALFLTLITTQAVEAIGLIYIRIENRTTLYFWLSLIKLITQVAANIFCIVYLDLGVLGMATATAFSSVAFAGVILLYVIRRAGLVLNAKVGVSMLLYSIPLWFSGLVSLYIGSSNRYLMSIYTTLEEIGLYSLAERLAAVVGVLIFSPFISYWSAERFRLQDRPDFDEIHQEVFKSVYVVLILVGLAICLYSDFILGVLAEESFQGAAKAIPYLVMGSIFFSLAQFYQYSFLSRNKTGVISKIMNITALGTTIFNFLLIPLWGFVGAAIAVSFSYFSLLLLSRHFAAPIYDMQLPLGRFFLSLSIAAIGVVLAAGLDANPFTLQGFCLLAVLYFLVAISILKVNFRLKEVRGYFVQWRA